MSDEPIPYVEGEPPPSPRHVRAILRGDDGTPDQEVWLDPETLNQGPLQHADINELLPILRWLWRHIGEYATWCRSFEDWEIGFLRDSNPDREVAQWVMIAYATLDFTHLHPTANRQAVFQAAVQLSNGNDAGIEPPRVADELKQLMASPPQALADLASFTEDGEFTPGPSHLR